MNAQKNADISVLSNFLAIFFHFFFDIEKFYQVLYTCHISDQLDHSNRNYRGGHTNLQEARPVYGLRPLYLNLNIIQSSQTFYVIVFLLHIRITILLLIRYIIHHPSLFFSFFFLSLRLCLILLHPFGYRSPSLNILPPFNFPLLCHSIIYVYNLSFLILQSHNFILSLLFSSFSIPNHHTWQRAKPKPRILNFFSKFLYFAIGSLIL